MRLCNLGWLVLSAGELGDGIRRKSSSPQHVHVAIHSTISLRSSGLVRVWRSSRSSLRGNVLRLGRDASGSGEG